MRLWPLKPQTSAGSTTQSESFKFLANSCQNLVTVLFRHCIGQHTRLYRPKPSPSDSHAAHQVAATIPGVLLDVKNHSCFILCFVHRVQRDSYGIHANHLVLLYPSYQTTRHAFMSVRSSTRAPGQSVHVSAVMNRMPVSGLCGFTG